MSDIARMIDAVIRDALALSLKEDGYKKTGRNFHKVSKAVIRVVNVQASQWNYDGSGQFTINLGIYLPRIAKLTDREYRGKGLPKGHNCTGSERIGTLMPKGLDYWWTVTTRTSTAALAKHLAKSWQEYGKPWLDEPWEDLRAARKLLLSNDQWWGAIAASVLLGDLDWASRELRKIIKEMKGSGEESPPEWLIKRAKRMGIALD